MVTGSNFGVDEPPPSRWSQRASAQAAPLNVPHSAAESSPGLDAARIHSVLCAALFLLIAGSAFAPWLDARAARSAASVAGVSFPFVGWLGTCAALCGGLVIVWDAIQGRGPSKVAKVFAASLAAGVIGYLVLVETAAAIIPVDWLPEGVRRLAVDLGAGWGAWLAAVGVIAVVSCVNWRPVYEDLSVDYLSSRVYLAVGICGAISAALSRYSSWVNGRFETESVSVPGWAIPFAGMLSLSLVFAMTLSFVAWISVRRRWAGWFVVLSGFCYALLSGSIVALTRAVGRLDAELWLPGDVADDLIAVSPGRGAIGAVASGLTMMAFGVVLVRRSNAAGSRSGIRALLARSIRDRAAS